MKQLSIQVDHKQYPGGKVPVLKQISMTVEAGEFVAVVGPSGAGKTTLMNIIAGLDHQMQGHVDLREGTASLKPKIGYVFQSPRMMPWMSIADNLRLVLEGVPDAETRIKAMLDAVGLAHASDLFPGELSGGMLRRAGIARAFVVQPDILLLDEPFVSVDAPTAMRLRQLLIDLWQEQQPMVILISHVLKEAIALADRIVFLAAEPGRVVHQIEIPPAARRQSPDSVEVQQIHDRLLEQHPEILSGLVSSRQAEDSAS